MDVLLQSLESINSLYNIRHSVLYQVVYIVRSECCNSCDSASQIHFDAILSTTKIIISETAGEIAGSQIELCHIDVNELRMSPHPWNCYSISDAQSQQPQSAVAAAGARDTSHAQSDADDAVSSCILTCSNGCTGGKSNRDHSYFRVLG